MSGRGRLSGSRVLVVGVGPGLGSAIAYFALLEGASVVIAARSGRVREIAEKLSRYGRVVPVVGDASRLRGAEEIVEAAARELGGIDHLVVSAGGYAETPIEELGEEQLEEMVSLNLKAHVYSVKAALRYLREGSSVVLVSSMGGAYRVWPRHSAYLASKAAAARLVEALAVELMPRGIRVNGVAPGGMRPDFEPGRDWRGLRRLGDPVAPPEDVARVVVWLLTDEASWVTGAVIPVDGGRRLI